MHGSSQMQAAGSFDGVATDLGLRTLLPTDRATAVLSVYRVVDYPAIVARFVDSLGNRGVRGRGRVRGRSLRLRLCVGSECHSR